MRKLITIGIKCIVMEKRNQIQWEFHITFQLRNTAPRSLVPKDWEVPPSTSDPNFGRQYKRYSRLYYWIQWLPYPQPRSTCINQRRQSQVQRTCGRNRCPDNMPPAPTSVHRDTYSVRMMFKEHSNLGDFKMSKSIFSKLHADSPNITVNWFSRQNEETAKVQQASVTHTSGPRERNSWAVSYWITEDLVPERHKCFPAHHPHFSRNSVPRANGCQRVCATDAKNKCLALETYRKNVKINYKN